MNSGDPSSPLRMAPPESAEELARRFEREQRRVRDTLQDALETGAAGFRIGSVPYLNAAPLTRGLEGRMVMLPPSELAQAMRRGELDAALLSVTEVLLHDRFDVLDGVAVASLGEVRSVFLAHKTPLAELREVVCDAASLTSVHLLRVLLAERGLHPKLMAVDLSRDDRGNALPDDVLLIGDRALRFSLEPHEHALWDLGAAWTDMTGLPFVYAVWVMRRGEGLQPLCRLLRETRKFGMDTLDALIAERTEFTYEFRKDYLGWHLHYHLGTDERRGIARFGELLERHGCGPVFAPRYI